MITLGECVTFLSGGTPSKSNPSYWDGEIPWVSCKDMKVDRLYDAEDHITELGAQNGTRLVDGGTILIVVRGMILAKVFPVAIAQRKVAFNQDLKALICRNGVVSEYLYYWLKAHQHEIVGMADEAAHGTKRLQTDRLLAMDVELPEENYQRSVAAVLSAYDDLIENNTRRIQILEEMARRIYEEWFVRFRFPGHENVRMVESQLGLIPGGWSVTTLEKVGTINRLSIRRGKEPTQIVYVDIASVSTGKIDNVQEISFIEAPGRARRIVRHGDIIWSNVRPNRKSFALITNPPQNMIVSTGFTVISASSVPYSFLYHALTTEDFASYLTNRAKGAAYPAVGSEDFANAKMIIPSSELLSTFDEMAEPMQMEKNLLVKKNVILTRTRDLLLPKLISGEIDVSNFPEPVID